MIDFKNHSNWIDRLRTCGAHPAVIVAMLFPILFLFFRAVAAPGAWWGDGQELACAAWTLGIPHPTGYPLYMLLGHAWMKSLCAISPGLDPGRALTLFSTACVALGMALLMPLLHRAASMRAGLPQLHARVLGLGLALMFGFTATLANHATFAEVYPLTFLFVVVLLLIAFDHRPSPHLARAVALGIAFGLAALNHYSIAAWAPLVLLILLRWGRAAGHPLRFAASGILSGAVCLLGYIYLPLRAAANPPLNWGDPSNFERLCWVLSGGQFTQIKITGEGAGSRFIAWIAWWGWQWLPSTAGLATSLLLGLVVLGIAAYGLWLLRRTHRELAAGAAAALLLTALTPMFYTIRDIEPYFLPAIPAAALGWAVAFAEGIVVSRRTWLVALPCVAALLLGVGLFARIDKSADLTPQQWSERTLTALPDGALVITAGDADIYSLWYRQIVLGERPDLTVYGAGFVFSGWYQRYFESAGRPQVPVFAEYRDPPVGDVEGPAIANGALLAGVILPNFAQGRRVFATFADPMFMDLFKPTIAARDLLVERDYLLTQYPSGRPGPVLYELHPNPELAGLTREQMVNKLRWWYTEQQRRSRR